MNNVTAMRDEQVTIESSAMLVEINIKAWTAFMLDKGVTAEVNKDKHAEAGAARVNKNLFKGVPELEAVKQYARTVRGWLYTNTLPWSDTGPRLLPTAAFNDFKTELNEHVIEYDRLVLGFLNAYNTLIGNQAFKLGTMFNREDYPSRYTVQEKFDIVASFSPLPQAGDFRVDIGHEALSDLETTYAQQYDERFESAMDDIKLRLMDGLKHLSERLEYEDNGKKKVFRDSAVENVIDMLRATKVLNITKDEALEAARTEAERVLATTSAKDLRSDDGSRKETKAKLDAIINSMAI